MDFSLGKHRVIRSRTGIDASVRTKETLSSANLVIQAHSLSAGSLHNLPTYEKPLNAIISLPEVDKIAIDRIKVLKVSAETSVRSRSSKT